MGFKYIFNQFINNIFTWKYCIIYYSQMADIQRCINFQK